MQEVVVPMQQIQSAQAEIMAPMDEMPMTETQKMIMSDESEDMAPAVAPTDLAQTYVSA